MGRSGLLWLSAVWLLLLACSRAPSSETPVVATPELKEVLPTLAPTPTLKPQPPTPTVLPACGKMEHACPSGFECTAEGSCRQANTKGGAQVWVPPGSFGMGCNIDQGLPCYPDEVPWHTVELSAFAIDETEVTVGDYRACVEAGACTAPRTKARVNRCTYVQKEERLPVNCVTWFQANDFCLWVGKELPTEAQWEKAARGTQGLRYPWGMEAIDCSRANVFMPPRFCVGDPAKVGSYPTGRGPYGTLDQLGNLLEWTRDWYDARYYYDSAEKDPLGPPQTGKRGLRGSSFSDAIRGGQYNSARYYLEPDTASALVGFRCARTLE